MSSRKKIVITGASGFLGSHLLERLKKNDNYTIYALSSRPDYLKETIGGTVVKYLHKEAIYKTAEFMEEAIIVNCAYPRNSTGMAIADGLKYIQAVFEKSVENCAKAIINISSQSVYSQQRTEAASENTSVCLESPYAVGKYAIELMLESICKGSSTTYTSIRMASLIGPGFDQRIVNRFVNQAIETGKLTVKRNQQKFGFFDVEDAVSGIVAMLDSSVGQWKQVYNLGKDGAYTLIEIAEVVKESLAGKKEVEISIIEGIEKCNTEIICSLHSKEFGFDYQYSLRQSVLRIVEKAIAQKGNV